MTMLTFVCSAYDRPHLLPVALHSLRANPDFADWECIVTDNAKNKDMARQHQAAVLGTNDPRYSYLATKMDDCYQSAEAGIAKARGKYVHLLCDDTYLMPYFAAKMVGAGIANGWDFVACNGIYGPDTYGGEQYTDVNVGPRKFFGKVSYIFARDKFRGFRLPANGAPILADRSLAAEFTAPGRRWGQVHERLFVHN